MAKSTWLVGTPSSIYAAPFSTLLPTNSPSPSSPPAPRDSANVGILVGVVLGVSTLVAIVVVLAAVIVIATRTRKMKTHSVDEQGAAEKTMSKTRSLRYVRQKTGDLLSINKNVTVGEEDNERQKHVQIVNRGYMLASNEPHSNDRITNTPDNPDGVGVELSTKPKEEGDGDSNYSEVQINTGLQSNDSIVVNDNVAYNLDEDDIATLNNALGTQFKPLESNAQTADISPQEMRGAIMRNKPRSITATGLTDESVKYDYPENFLHSESAPVGDVAANGKHQSIIYDVPQVTVQADKHLTEKANHSSEQEILYQNQQGIYYNQIGQGEVVEEVIYSNQEVEDPEEIMYYNQEEVMN